MRFNPNFAQRVMPTLLGILCVPVLAMMLMRCAPIPQTSIATDTFCQNAKPIRLSRADGLTPETHEMILEHNAVGMKLCGWK